MTDIYWANPLVESLIFAEAAQRRDSYAALTRQVTPQLAFNAAQIAQAYPQFPGALVTGLALQGTDPASPAVQALGDQLAQLEAQAPRPAPGPEVGYNVQEPDEPGFFGKIGQGIKAGVKGLFLAFDFLWEETIQRPLRAAVGNYQAERPWYEVAFAPFFPSSPGYKASGPSIGNIALHASLQGHKVNLGSGWFLDSDLAPETERALADGVPFMEAIANPAQMELGVPIAHLQRHLREQVQIPTGPGSQETFNVTPGRLIATQFVEQSASEFNWFSGILDFAANVVLDPANAGLGLLGSARKAAGVLHSPTIRNPGVFSRKIDEFLATRHGAQVQADLGAITDYATMLDILGRSQRRAGGQTTPGLNQMALRLTRADADEVGAILSSLGKEDNLVLNHVLGPQSLIGRISGRRATPFSDVASRVMAPGLSRPAQRLGGPGMSLRYTLDGTWMGRMAAAVGGKFIGVHDLERGMVDLREWMRAAGFSHARQSHYLEALAVAERTLHMQNVMGIGPGPMADPFKVAREAVLKKSVVSPEGLAGMTTRQLDRYDTVFHVVTSMVDEWSDTLLESGLPQAAVRAFGQIFADASEARVYFRNLANQAQFFPGAKMEMLAGGKIHTMESAHLWSEFLNQAIPLPDARKVRAAMRRAAVGHRSERAAQYFAKNVSDWDAIGTNTIMMLGDNYMQKIWKPLVLLRAAWPVRVVGEEQIRLAVSGLANVFTHPIQTIAWAMAKNVGDLDVVGMKMEDVTKFQQTMSGHGLSNILHHRGVSSPAESWSTVPFGHARWAEGQLVQIQLLNKDDLARTLAGGSAKYHAPLDDLTSAFHPYLDDQLPAAQRAAAFDALDDEAEVWVFHASSREGADRLTREGWKPGEYRGTATGSFEMPGDALFVSFDHWRIAKKYGEGELVAFRVPKSHLRASQEAETLSRPWWNGDDEVTTGLAAMDPGHGAVIRAPIPAERVYRILPADFAYEGQQADSLQVLARAVRRSRVEQVPVREMSVEDLLAEYGPGELVFHGTDTAGAQGIVGTETPPFHEGGITNKLDYAMEYAAPDPERGPGGAVVVWLRRDLHPTLSERLGRPERVEFSFEAGAPVPIELTFEVGPTKGRTVSDWYQGLDNPLAVIDTETGRAFVYPREEFAPDVVAETIGPREAKQMFWDNELGHRAEMAQEGGNRSLLEERMYSDGYVDSVNARIVMQTGGDAIAFDHRAFQYWDMTGQQLRRKEVEELIGEPLITSESPVRVVSEPPPTNIPPEERILYGPDDLVGDPWVRAMGEIGLDPDEAHQVLDFHEGYFSIASLEETLPEILQQMDEAVASGNAKQLEEALDELLRRTLDHEPGLDVGTIEGLPVWRWANEVDPSGTLASAYERYARAVHDLYYFTGWNRSPDVLGEGNVIRPDFWDNFGDEGPELIELTRNLGRTAEDLAPRLAQFDPTDMVPVEPVPLAPPGPRPYGSTEVERSEWATELAANPELRRAMEAFIDPETGIPDMEAFAQVYASWEPMAYMQPIPTDYADDVYLLGEADVVTYNRDGTTSFRPSDVGGERIDSPRPQEFPLVPHEAPKGYRPWGWVIAKGSDPKARPGLEFSYRVEPRTVIVVRDGHVVAQMHFRLGAEVHPMPRMGSRRAGVTMVDSLQGVGPTDPKSAKDVWRMFNMLLERGILDADSMRHMLLGDVPILEAARASAKFMLGIPAERLPNTWDEALDTILQTGGAIGAFAPAQTNRPTMTLRSAELMGRLVKMMTRRGGRHHSPWHVDNLRHHRMEFIPTRPGNRELIEMIATGKLRGMDIHNRKNYAEIYKILENEFGDQLPKFAKVAKKPDVNLGTQWDKAVSTMFQWLMSKPTNYLSRSPAFRQFYWRKIGELLPLATAEDQATMLMRAKEAGIGRDSLRAWIKRIVRGDEDVADEDVVRGLERLLSEGHTLEGNILATGAAAGGDIEDIQHLDEIAKAAALEQTRRLLYDLSKRSNFFDMTRLIFPFGEAWFEIISTWGRLVKENPNVLRRLQQGIEGARESGVVYEDPNTGEEVFNYPGAGLLASWMFDPIDREAEAAGEEVGPGRGTVAGPQMTGRVLGLNLMLGSWLPGMGPVVQIPASQLEFLKDPDWKFVRELVLPFGATDIESPGGLVDTQLPAWFRKALAALGKPTGDDERLFANTVIDVYRTLLLNGGDDSTPEAHAAMLEEAKRLARGIYRIRAISQFAGPTGAQVRWDARDREGRTWALQALATEYRVILDKHDYDQNAAFREFTEVFGLDPSGLYTAKTRSVRRRSVTEAGYEWEWDHPELFEEFPLTAYYARPDDPDEEFDYPAYLKQLKDKNRVALTPEQWVRERNDFLGRLAYEKARRIAGIAPGAATDAWLRNIRYQLMNRYPGFNEDLVGGVQQASRDQVIRELETWRTNDDLTATETGQGLAIYMDARQMAMVQSESMGLSPLGFRSAARTRVLRDWLRTIAQDAIRQYPDFGVLWDQVLSSELDDETSSFNLMGVSL